MIRLAMEDIMATVDILFMWHLLSIWDILGICRLDLDLELALDLLDCEFAPLKETDPETFNFLTTMINDYVKGFLLYGPFDPKCWNY